MRLPTEERQRIRRMNGSGVKPPVWVRPSALDASVAPAGAAKPLGAFAAAVAALALVGLALFAAVRWSGIVFDGFALFSDGIVR